MESCLGLTAVTILIISVLVSQATAKDSLLFEPSQLTLVVRSGAQFNVSVVNCSTGTFFSLNLDSQDPRVLYLDDPSTLKNITCNRVYSSSVSSGMMGFTSFSVRLTELSSGLQVGTETYSVGVTPPPGGVLGQVFSIGTSIGLVILTFGFGVEIDFQVVKKTLKRPYAPVIGGVGQFIVMPLLAFGLAEAGDFHPAIKLGILVFAAVPGGGASNIIAYLMDANLSLSITMTLISTLGSLGMTTLWLLTLGKYLTEGSLITVPYTSILTSLALLIGPLILGVLVSRFLPRVAKVLIKAQRVAVIIVSVFITTLGIWTNTVMFEYCFLNWKLFLCGMSIPILGALLSGATAAAFKSSWTDIKSVAIETAVQNMQVGVVILTTSQESPWKEITSGIPVVLGLCTVVPSLTFGAIRTVWVRLRTKKKDLPEVPPVDDIKLSESITSTSSEEGSDKNLQNSGQMLAV